MDEESGTRYDAKGTNNLESKADPIIQPETYGSELVINGGFEAYTGTQDDGVTDTFNGWTSYSGLVEATATAHSGSDAVKLTYGNNVLIYNTLNVVAGATYTFSFWSRGDGTNSLHYSIYDLDHSYATIAVAYGASGINYQLVTATITIPAGCTHINPQFTVYNSGNAYLDDVSFRQIATPAINNGGFETVPGSSGRHFAGAWNGYYGESTSGASTISDETNLINVYSGNHAARIDSDSSGRQVTLGGLSIDSSKKYLATFYAKSSLNSAKLYLYDNYQGGAGYQYFTLGTGYAKYTAYITSHYYFGFSNTVPDSSSKSQYPLRAESFLIKSGSPKYLTLLLEL